MVLLFCTRWLFNNHDESHFSSIELLLNNRADVNSQEDDGVTPLHCLVRKGNVKVIQLLLDFGADFKIEDNDGEIPLGSAIGQNSNVEVVKFLMDLSSMDINSELGNSLKWTPLQLACMSANLEIVRYLVKNGANANAMGSDGNAALLLNLLCEPDPSVVKLLMKSTDFSTSLMLMDTPLWTLKSRKQR